MEQKYVNLGARKPVLLVELVELERVVKESHFSEQNFWFIDFVLFI
jgi:hypothetical protein